MNLNNGIMPSIQDQINEMVTKQVKVEFDKLKDELKKQIPSIQMQVRQEVFQSFKLITGIIVEQEFVKVYGHNFDLNSLQNSLIYIPSSTELEPKLSYDSKNFRFYDTIYLENNKFNQNARRWERKNRKYINPGFYVNTGEMSDFYDQMEFQEYLDSDLDETEDYLRELSLEYDNFTFNSKRNPTERINVEKTFKTAIKKAEIGFYNEWRGIKNRLEKKYNIIIK